MLIKVYELLCQATMHCIFSIIIVLAKNLGNSIKEIKPLTQAGHEEHLYLDYRTILVKNYLHKSYVLGIPGILPAQNAHL